MSTMDQHYHNKAHRKFSITSRRLSFQVEAERKKERKLARAEEKASRAKKLGMKLPGQSATSTNKPGRGWEGLRQRLREGTLLPALQRIESQMSHKERARKSGMHHLSDIYQKLKKNAAFQVGVDAAGQRLQALDAKAEQEEQNKMREERKIRRKLIKKQRKLERELEYLNFPTIVGWYFDGFFTPYFQLKEDWAKIFNQMEVEISIKKEKSTEETFAEKAKRYFWPPDLIAGVCFRTRGIYLDFEDIIMDPPHTPPDIVLDQNTEAVTLFMNKEGVEEPESKMASEEDEDQDVTPAQLQALDEKLQQMLRDIENDPLLSEEEKARRKKELLLAYKRKKDRMLLMQQLREYGKSKGIGKNDYYFDDQVGAFFRKRPRAADQYYFDTTWGIWRCKRKIIYFATDYYWDEQLGQFFPKDRTRRQTYYDYDPKLAVFRVHGEDPPLNWRGVKPSHFYFDHKLGKWIKKSYAPAGIKIEWDQNGLRYVANKETDTPDDYYFDCQQNTYAKKDNGKNFYFDPEFGSWRRNNTPLPVKGTDRIRAFYWNENENTFVPRDAPSSFFDWDQNNYIYRKKRALTGRYHPKNWIWNEKTGEWELRKKHERHLLSSLSVTWVPDRDYDKPWLEYIGGYKDYHVEYDYDAFFDDEMRPRTADGSFAGGGGKGAKKAKFAGSASDPNLRNSMTQGEAEEEPEKMDDLMFVDTLDRKTLKITWQGPALTDIDIRKYFASVKKIVRPKNPKNENLEEDYAYLKFKTDEAAAAALRTMHDHPIKGTRVFLQYKLKTEDETIGGQKNVGSDKQGKRKVFKPEDMSQKDEKK